MHGRPIARFGAVILVCLMSLSAALLAMVAHSQGIMATAKPPSVSRSADIATMRRRADELERRVVELEKESADEAEADKDEVAVDKTMEQRLAAVEAEQRDAAAKAGAGDGQESSHRLDLQVVRAPFVVVDANGKRLVTIDRSEITQSARPTVGDPKWSSVVLAAKGDTAIVQLIIDQSDKPKVWVAADPNASGNKLMIVQEITKGVGILRMGSSNYGMAPAMQNQGLRGVASSARKTDDSRRRNV